MSRRGSRSRSLRRRPAFRNPKVKITAVCEGKLTEPQYIHAMARHCGALVAIELVVEKGAGVPLSVVDRAIEIWRSRSKDSFERNDQVWVVFDRDEHPKFIEAIAKAESVGISVAYSNPCFELWLVLHYQDHDRPVGRDDIQKTLRTLMPGYDPNRSKQALFHEICDASERAEARAELMERRRDEERNAKGNPSTSVFKLTREIRKHSNN
jgi:RloB-like protein